MNKPVENIFNYLIAISGTKPYTTLKADPLVRWTGVVLRITYRGRQVICLSFNLFLVGKEYYSLHACHAYRLLSGAKAEIAIMQPLHWMIGRFGVPSNLRSWIKKRMDM